MFIGDIDFVDSYRRQLQLAKRIEKKPERWDKCTEKTTENCASLTDSYLLQPLGKIDLRGAESPFGTGCGSDTVSLALTKEVPVVYGVDYGRGMLSVAARHAAQMNTHYVQQAQRVWEGHRDDLPQCDIAVALRSTLVADMRRTMTKLNNQARP